MNTLFGISPPDRRFAAARPMDWERVNADGFGDPFNMACHSLCEFQGDLYAGLMNYDDVPVQTNYGAQVWRANFPSTWYLAEGATAGDFELVFIHKAAPA